MGQKEPTVRGSSSLTQASILIPGLPNEVALMILVRLPRALHGSFRRVCSAWRVALQLSVVSPLRNTLHISEMWMLFFFKRRSMIALYDPLLQHLSSPSPACYGGANWLGQVVGALGNQVFFLVRKRQPNLMSAHICSFDITSMLWQSNPNLMSAHIRPFDITSMQWQSNPVPFLWSNTLLVGFASVVVDDQLWVAGGGGNGREVGRLDLRSRTWEMMPNMHEARRAAAAVVLQGRLHVIGGGNSYHSKDVPSGEIWDPRSGEWMLKPELWPAQLISHLRPKVAVVMDTLYAIKYGINGFEDDDDDDDIELFQYSSESKLWTSLGYLPVEEYTCSCGRADITQLVGAGKELWVVLKCTLQRCTSTILSCVPSIRSSPLLWNRVPITSNTYFPSGDVVVHGNLHV